jgi:hypothetical protein
MDLARRWGWSQTAAEKLLDHLQQYRANQGIFEGGLPNTEDWWRHRPVTAEQCPLKAMAMILHAIVPHAAEIERLFSDLGKTQGDSRSNLNVTTIRSLGRLRGHYQETLRERNLLKRRRHAHMHTREDGGVDADAIPGLMSSGSGPAPPDDGADGAQAAEIMHVEPEGFAERQLEIAFEQLDAARADEGEDGWKDGRSDGEVRYIEHARKAGVRPGDVFDFDELEKVVAGTPPTPDIENVHAHRSARGSAAGEWDVEALLKQKGI